MLSFPFWEQASFMRIISRKALHEFSQAQPSAKVPLDAWYAEVHRARWVNFAEVRQRFNAADAVSGNRVIFNIGGNQYRLVVKIAYLSGIVFVRYIGTHAEYDRINAQTI